MKNLAHLVFGVVGLSAATGLGLIGLGLIGTAQAQTDAARVELLPIPNTLPDILFDPAPLSGAMLKPLAVAEPAIARPAELPPAAPQQEASPAPAAAPAAPPAAESPAEPTAAVPDSGPDAAPSPEGTPADKPVIEAVPEPAPKPKKPPAPATTTVTVIVEGVESSKGVVNVALCDKSLSREGCPYTKATPAAAGFVEARFDDVPPGVYAVVGYHDVNGNDEFDKMLGVPREPYALSNKAGEMLVPGFKDAALNIKKGDNTVIIRMQRLGS